MDNPYIIHNKDIRLINSYHIKTLEGNIDGIKSNPFECNKHIIKTIQRQIDAWKEAEK